MKRALVIALSAIILFSIVACNNTSDKENKTEVIIWHTWNVGEGEGEHELQVAVDEFNASQDEIIAKLEAQPSSGFNDKVYNSVVNGVGPDIIFDFATAVCDYQGDGLLANMEDYIDVEAFRARVSDATWNESWSSEDGHLHIVPIQSTAPVLFYNKTLYDKHNLKAPSTWEELESNSKIIYEKEKIAGFATDSFIDLAQTMFMQNGSGYIDVSTSTVTFNTPKSRDNVTWLVNGTKEGYFTSNYSSGSIDTEFNSGLLASFLGTCSYEPYIIPNGFEFGVAELPAMGENSWIPQFNRGAIVFASDKTTEAAACKFIEFFTNEENSMRWCTTIGGLSPYSDTRQRDDYQGYIRNSLTLQVASEAMNSAGTTPAVKGAVAVRSEIKRLYLQAVGEINTVENLFEIAEKNCNEALKK